MAKLKKWGGYLLIFFALFYWLMQPETVANIVRGAAGLVMTGADSFVRFMNALFQGVF